MPRKKNSRHIQIPRQVGLKQLLKIVFEFFWNCVDWLLRLRHVSCETRVEFYAVCRKALREFCHNGKGSKAADCDPSKVLGRVFNSKDRPRILVDVSQMVLINARSGIQRVVIKILDAMLKDHRCAYVPVAYFHGHMYYVEYHQEDCSFHMVERLQFMEADILLMLDSSWDHCKAFRKVFKQIRLLNGRICAVVYDLIPVMLPQYTDTHMPQMFKTWLHTAIQESDEILCISATVAEQLHDYIRRNRIPIRPDGLKIGHFYLGADFTQADSRPADPDIAKILEQTGKRTKFLSVSTLEPRKNYDFMLKVVEKLWEKGFDIVYFIVGKKGWNTDDVVRKISGHPELNKRLFWFPYCNDSTLQLLYQKSDVLLNLSRGEGYGLSLVEGAHCRCAVIASDIPVFHEVFPDGSALFCNIDSLEDTGETIAGKLADGQLVPSNAKRFLWKDSLDQILDLLQQGNWDFTLNQ